MNYTEFINKYGLTMECKQTDANPLMDNDMFHWSVTIRNGNKAMTLPFSCGGAHVQPTTGAVRPTFASYSQTDVINARKETGVYYDFKLKQYRKAGAAGATLWKKEVYQLAFEPKPPTLENVLNCLALDTSALDEPFEDWAINFGYDTDSIKAKNIYDACIKNALDLRRAGIDLDELRDCEEN